MTARIPFDLDLLRRRPDLEASELVAVDAADRLLLDTAAGRLADAEAGGTGGAGASGGTGSIVTINDSYGALTLGAAGLSGRADIRAFQDGIVHERALALNAAEQGLEHCYRSCELGPDLLAGAGTVLLRLPRSLDELDEIAWSIAAYARPDVVVLAAGRIKHMALSMNTVLGRHFTDVSAGLARQKSRVLVASGPRPVGTATWPRSARLDVGLDDPLELRAFGATFGGAALDPGTALLLPHLRKLAVPDDPSLRTVVDLGCGNGAIAAYLALTHPDLAVLATDQSASATASTEATAAANRLSDRITVRRDDALAAIPDASVRTIVLNPPFHIGSTVHTGIAHKLFGACARVLAPGGQLWAVWNSHLGYRPFLERTIGPTHQLDRSPRFTVTRSTRR